MIPLSLTLIAIPDPVWTRLPRDRPLAELAKDARGAMRRVAKQVDERRDTARFTRLAAFIEATALDLLRLSREPAALPSPNLTGEPLEGMRALEWLDITGGPRNASIYVSLLEYLSSAEASLLPPPSDPGMDDGSRADGGQVEGNTIHPPGEAVGRQRTLAEHLVGSLSDPALAKLPPLIGRALPLILSDRLTFFRAAEADGSAVVEVLSQMSG